MSDVVETIVKRLEELGRISEEPNRLTRRFATRAMQQTNGLVRQWMIEAGMTVRQDAIGNLIGHYPGATTGAKILMLGSHLDSVPNAGKYDGPLGVVLAIAAVARLRGRKLPFAIEVIAFADEEGTRFHTNYLGSRAVAGEFASESLNYKDAEGIELRTALEQFGGDPAKIKSCKIKKSNLLGYVEVHIEQGPVLERANLAVGVVTAIAGQTRASVSFLGKAGHAGTTPMNQRNDALVKAARFVLEVERFARKQKGLVATVGQMAILPGASNVIPGQVTLTLDVRHEIDSKRIAAANHFEREAAKVSSFWNIVNQTPTVGCSPRFVGQMKKSALRHQSRILNLVSGAGHDAAMMANICPVVMLFVRCRDGLSHHPDESVKPADIGVACSVLSDYVNEFV